MEAEEYDVIVETCTDQDSESHRPRGMGRIKSSSVFTVVAEVTLWLLMSILTLMLAYNVIGVEPFRRGFYCDDETIRYPYKDDTVSDILVAIIFVAVPMVVMIIIETAHAISARNRLTDEKKYLAQKLWVKLYRSIGAFLFATACTLFLTETMKLFGGRLRPHFISLCKPDFSKLNCSNGYVMIENDMCTSDVTKNKLLDSRKSFPSGHASLSTFGSIYLLAYLQFRFVWTKKIRILLPLLQIGILCASAFVCISRVNDNKHHFSDVIAGAILGTAIALLSLKYVSCIRKDASLETGSLHEPSRDISTFPSVINNISTTSQPTTTTGNFTNTHVVEMKHL